jgi:hypothetical protein
MPSHDQEIVMRTTRGLRALLLTTLAGAALSCSDSMGSGSSGPDGSRPDGELNVVALAPSSAPLLYPADSFYAVRGQNREVRIFFQSPSGGQGEEYLRLRIDARTLLARPDGTPVAEGDSVLIHVSVVDPARMLFDLEPSGLQFNPLEPAELKIHYSHADGDLNDDGAVNGEDDSIETTLAIWRQEHPGDPFVRLSSILSLELDEADAELTGFSRYALAY